MAIMKRPTVRSTFSRSERGIALRSEDGALEFTLMRTAGGVFVERVEQRRSTARVVQSALFADGVNFIRWCDADSARHNYPLVYTRLKHDGHALFSR